MTISLTLMLIHQSLERNRYIFKHINSNFTNLLTETKIDTHIRSINVHPGLFVFFRVITWFTSLLAIICTDEPSSSHKKT